MNPDDYGNDVLVVWIVSHVGAIVVAMSRRIVCRGKELDQVLHGCFNVLMLYLHDGFVFSLDLALDVIKVEGSGDRICCQQYENANAGR